MRKIILGGGLAAIIAAGAAIAAVNATDSGGKSDVDKDGKITLAEMQQRTAERFKRLDTNGDGTVTKEERQAARDSWREHRGGRHGDGGPGRGGGRGDFFGRLDTDGNGAVSMPEFNAKSAERFARLDSNKDGQVSKDEFEAAREGFRGRHHRGDREG